MRNKLVQERMRLLKQMHQYVIDLGDEDLYIWWIRDGIPDCPDDDILEFIANDDEEWRDCCDLLYKIYQIAKGEQTMRKIKFITKVYCYKEYEIETEETGSPYDIADNFLAEEDHPETAIVHEGDTEVEIVEAKEI